MSGDEATEGQIDYSGIDKQIDFAEKYDFRIVYLVEASPVYVNPWLKEKCIKAGEMQINDNGAVDLLPSMSSKVFNDWQESFVRKTIDYIEKRDTKGVVVGYCPGAEWWYPSNCRFSPLGTAALRKWLKSEYGAVSNLNARWRSYYESFEKEENTKLIVSSPIGRADGLSTLWPAERAGRDCSWSASKDAPVQEGRELCIKG